MARYNPGIVIALLLTAVLKSAQAEVIQTFFNNPCAYGTMLDFGSPYRTFMDLSLVSCAVMCTQDVKCAAYTHPPCVLHSVDQSLACALPGQQATTDTFVKQVTDILIDCTPFTHIVQLRYNNTITFSSNDRTHIAIGVTNVNFVLALQKIVTSTSVENLEDVQNMPMFIVIHVYTST